jgi:hypothetical protein
MRQFVRLIGHVAAALLIVAANAACGGKAITGDLASGSGTGGMAGSGSSGSSGTSNAGGSGTGGAGGMNTGGTAGFDGLSSPGGSTSTGGSVTPPDAESGPVCPATDWISLTASWHPDPLRACAVDTDCVLQEQVCCAYHAIIGLAKTTTCIPAPMTGCDQPNCSGYEQNYVTDDGRGTTGLPEIQVRCESGFCRSLGPDCAGQPCPDGYVCVHSDQPACISIPTYCVAGSDPDCARLLCEFGGTWHGPRDVDCMPTI